MYLAPHLLNGRFSDKKYYDHALELGAIMKTTLCFDITLEDTCWKWAIASMANMSPFLKIYLAFFGN